PGVRAIGEQELGHRGVAEDSRLLLLEDAVARERTKEAIERVLVSACLRSDLRDRPRAVGETIRDAEIRDEPERLRRHRAADERPHLRFDRGLAHRRAAM